MRFYVHDLLYTLLTICCTAYCTTCCTQQLEVKPILHVIRFVVDLLYNTALNTLRNRLYHRLYNKLTAWPQQVVQQIHKRSEKDPARCRTCCVTDRSKWSLGYYSSSFHPRLDHYNALSTMMMMMMMMMMVVVFLLAAVCPALAGGGCVDWTQLSDGVEEWIDSTAVPEESTTIVRWSLRNVSFVPSVF